MKLWLWIKLLFNKLVQIKKKKKYIYIYIYINEITLKILSRVAHGVLV